MIPQVYITATLWSVGSEANIDNIFFMEDYCDPVPSNAQGTVCLSKLR